jgi:hypothetical protein
MSIRFDLKIMCFRSIHYFLVFLKPCWTSQRQSLQVGLKYRSPPLSIGSFLMTLPPNSLTHRRKSFVPVGLGDSHALGLVLQWRRWEWRAGWRSQWRRRCQRQRHKLWMIDGCCGRITELRSTGLFGDKGFWKVLGVVGLYVG